MSSFPEAEAEITVVLDSISVAKVGNMPIQCCMKSWGTAFGLATWDGGPEFLKRVGDPNKAPCNQRLS